VLSREKVMTHISHHDLALYPDTPLDSVYDLADHSGLIQDGRTVKTFSVDHRHVFFLGHQSEHQGRFFYFFSVLFADKPDSFNRGVAHIQDQLIEKHQLNCKLTLIYIRNLYAENEGIKTTEQFHGFTERIKHHQLSCRQGEYLVYGMLAGNQLMIHAGKGKDAFAGIQVGVKTAQTLPDKQFLPLKICLTELVSFLFDSLVESNLEEISNFIDTLPNPISETIH
jgi:hypothetical protein